jgi:hypothetical protein
MENAKGGLTRKRALRLLVWLPPVCVLLRWAFRRQAEILRWPAMTRELLPADSDVWLRLAQVRQFLTGHDFFDHAVRNTNAPFGGIAIHWTRPMDFLLSLFYYLTPADLSMTQRLLLSATWLPPIMGLICLGILLKAARRVFDNIHVLWIFISLLFASPLPTYFPPGECDHHGFLALLWSGVVCLLMRPLDRREAVLAGALSGLMIWVSTEGLMLYALTLIILGVAALKKPEEMKNFFLVTLAAAAVSAIGLMIEVPPEQIFTFQKNDTLSIVYVMLLTLIAGAACLLSCPVVTRMTFVRRFIASGIAAIIVLAIEIALFPKVLLGPLADADPFITHEFFARVMESKPLLGHPFDTILQHLWEPALAALLLMAAWKKDMTPLRRRQVLTLAGMLAGTLLMTLNQGRWTYYLQPPALVAIAGLLPGWSMALKTKWWRRQIDRPFRPYAALLFAGGIMAGLGAAFGSASGNPYLWNCQSELRYVIQTQQLQKLLGDKPRILYAPAEEGGDILFFTPYSIIAGEYHREGQGLKTLAELEAAKTQEEARKILQARKVDSMIVCPVFEKPDSWMRHLSPEHHPAWLTPVSGLEFMPLPGPKPYLFTVK